MLKKSTSNAKSPTSPKTPKSKKSTSKKSQSPKIPKTPKYKKSTSKKPQSPKTPKSHIATPNADATQKREKQRAVYDLKGGLIDHYAKLWDYKDEILSTNPGSTVQLDVDTLDDGKTQFKRMYICFKAMKEGWTSCRRVVGLDGCFLKSNCRGELLTAMGRDSNNQMFPMAWAVVSNENSKNWLWFLSNLGSDFNLAMGAYLTILSDGHKGLIEAVKELLPHVEHRLCARHIYANLKKKWNGLHHKSLLWGAASSTLEVKFKHKMELIKNSDPLAFDWLMEMDPKTWCRADFQMDRSCAAFENDPTFEDSSSTDPSAADSSVIDPSSADLSAADLTFADPNQSFTGLLNCVEQQIMGADITDAEIAALADMNEAEEREARRKDAERVLEEAKRKGVYRKRGACGWRGPSERIANQRRKKEDPNGPGKKPDTAL
ncbi:hypothetical protein Tco_1356317, partial [Tanacetum coccineum]